MKKKQTASLFPFALIIGLALTSAGCTVGLSILHHLAYQTEIFSDETEPYAEFKGYTVEVRDIIPKGSTTPSYLPEKIKFELRKRLVQKGIMIYTPIAGKLLMVDIVTEALSPPFGGKAVYVEIKSRIRVTDNDGKGIVAETTIYTHNPFGRDGDFAEITHANQIASFLEYVVR